MQPTHACESNRGPPNPKSISQFTVWQNSAQIYLLSLSLFIIAEFAGVPRSGMKQENSNFCTTNSQIGGWGGAGLTWQI